MEMKKLPIGIQDFAEIRENGYAYVDKTAFIPKLLEGKYYFLSRPRRFGKSLFLSTLHAYFAGRRELFNGLVLESADVDWTAHPVLHFDFNAEDYSVEKGLEYMLDISLRELEKKYGRSYEDVTPSQRLRSLIRAAYEQSGRKVVILVDEYDKPLLGIDEHREILESNQRLLKSFYGNLKTMDRMIRFVFLTGVARFSKVSIFSDLNHLEDISFDNAFADICGWTEEELYSNFKHQIGLLAEDRGEELSTTLSILRDYYDGYKFTVRGSRLYNPFSVLRALKSKELAPYWFQTGTPTFLVKRFKVLGIYPSDVNGCRCTREALMAVGLNDRNPIPLMFQTGYLTISSYSSELDEYELRFPNHEVKTGFYKELLTAYVPETYDPGSPFSFADFRRDLYAGKPKDFMARLATLLKGLPGEDHCESSYRAVTYLMTVLCGTQTTAEHHGYKGRSDIEVRTQNYVYLFEFKYNRSVEEAMEQIRDRDYAGRYSLESRRVYLIAANYNERKEERGLHYRILPLECI